MDYDAMRRRIILQNEELNLRLAMSALRTVHSQLRWLAVSSALFAGLGVYYIAIMIAGESWLYTIGVAGYFGVAYWLWRWGRKRWIAAGWRACRLAARARIILKSVCEES